jgi:hypothetical protein
MSGLGTSLQWLANFGRVPRWMRCSQFAYVKNWFHSHAGYSYSGPTAGWAYKQIDPTNMCVACLNLVWGLYDYCVATVRLVVPFPIFTLPLT